MKIAFYGNRQAGLVALLTAKALGHEFASLHTDTDEFKVWVEQTLGDKPFWAPIEEAQGGALLLCVHGKKIVSPAVLGRFRLGGVNVHPFLGKYPGADPVLRALEDGERNLVVMAHRMTREVDGGPRLAFAATVMPAGATTAGEVYNVLYPYYAMVVGIALKACAAQLQS